MYTRLKSRIIKDNVFDKPPFILKFYSNSCPEEYICRHAIFTPRIVSM